MIRKLLTVYFTFFVLNMAISTPENHMSTGVHQIVGDCDIFDTDLAGHKRQVLLYYHLKEDLVALFTFSNRFTFARRSLKRISILNVRISMNSNLRNWHMVLNGTLFAVTHIQTRPHTFWRKSFWPF